MASTRELTLDLNDRTDGVRTRRAVARTDPAFGVVETVAEIENTEPTGMEPLYDSVDPDALNGLFRRSRGTADTGIEVSFTYAGYDVTLSSASPRHRTPNELIGREIPDNGVDTS